VLPLALALCLLLSACGTPEPVPDAGPAAPGEGAVLERLEIVTPPAKTSYESGDAVDLSAVGSHDLADKLILGGLADGGGLAGDIQEDLGDAVCVKGCRHGDGAHAGGSGGIGARGIEAVSGGLGVHRAETDTGHGERGSASEGAFQEISSAEVGHKTFFLSCIMVLNEL